jgi:protein phosphatase
MMSWWLPIGRGLTLTAGVCTDRGRRRQHNEDNYLACAPVFLVADGMGGHLGGEIASSTALSAFSPLIDATGVEAAELLAVVDDAQLRVSALDRGIPPRGTGPGGRPPGCTLTGVAVHDQAGTPCWLVVNVGDSRTYRMADGVLTQISVDHSEIQDLIDSGTVDASVARSSGRRNVITRAIGAGLGATHQPDLFVVAMADRDRMLVCSDGLTNELTDQLIAAILGSTPDPQQAAEVLVTTACEAGGRDNVTVVVVDAVLSGASDADPPGDDEDWWGDTIPNPGRSVAVPLAQAAGALDPPDARS